MADEEQGDKNDRRRRETSNGASADPYQSILDAAASRACAELVVIVLTDPGIFDALIRVATAVGHSDPREEAWRQIRQLDGFTYSRRPWNPSDDED